MKITVGSNLLKAFIGSRVFPPFSSFKRLYTNSRLKELSVSNLVLKFMCCKTFCVETEILEDSESNEYSVTVITNELSTH